MNRYKKKKIGKLRHATVYRGKELLKETKHCHIGTGPFIKLINQQVYSRCLLCARTVRN